MSTEKVLNTRIQLKYDTLANWNSSTFKLKAGELAIVTLGKVKDGTSAGDINQHPVLFKVGTGNHTFSQLPYASALAADVYSWAKAANVKLEGKDLKFVDAEGKEIKSVNIPYITENEASTLISTALADYSTTAQMNTAISNAKTELEGKINPLVATVGNTESGLVKDVADLKAAVGEGGSIADVIANTIASLDSSASQTAGADGLALSVTQVDGKITAISGSIAAETYDAYGSAAAAQSAAVAAAKTETENQVKALADGKVKSNEDAIAAIKDDANIDSFADVVAELTKKQNNIPENTYDAYGTAAGVKDYADQTFATIANLDKYSLKYDSANKEFYLADETGTKQGDGIDAKPFIKDGMLTDVAYDAATNTIAFTWNTDSEVKTDTVVLSDILDPYQAVDTDTIDMTVNGVEISAEIKEGSITKTHLAKALVDDIDAKATEADLTEAENRIKALEDKATTGSVAKADVATSVAANGVDTAAIKDDAVTAAKLADDVVILIQGTKVSEAGTADVANSLADSAKAEVKAIKVDNAVNAEQLGGVAAANYALKTDVSDLANGQVNTNKENIATINQTLSGYGDVVTHNVTEFATSEQGRKADSALQSVEVGTGLKVSEKAENKQTIEIDDTVVFVFDCGTASKNID